MSTESGECQTSLFKQQSDEIYVVVIGEGEFVRGVSRVKFSSSDLLFVAKGEVHRFEKYTPDTAVWVIFWPGK